MARLPAYDPGRIAMYNPNRRLTDGFEGLELHMKGCGRGPKSCKEASTVDGHLDVREARGQVIVGRCDSLQRGLDVFAQEDLGPDGRARHDNMVAQMFWGVKYGNTPAWLAE
jgi:hypothetical protein